MDIAALEISELDKINAGELKGKKEEQGRDRY